MATSQDWDMVVRGFEGMYEYTKNAENGTGKQFADHALGMLDLVPRIRHLEEFNDIEFSSQLGKLKCRPKGKRASMSISYGEGRYYLFIYANDGTYSEINYPSNEIVDAVQRHLREII